MAESVGNKDLYQSHKNRQKNHQGYEEVRNKLAVHAFILASVNSFPKRDSPPSICHSETWWIDVACPGDQRECPENRFLYLSDLLCATVPSLRVRLKWRFCVMARTLYSLRS